MANRVAHAGVVPGVSPQRSVSRSARIGVRSHCRRFANPASPSCVGAWLGSCACGGLCVDRVISGAPCAARIGCPSSVAGGLPGSLACTPVIVSSPSPRVRDRYILVRGARSNTVHSRAAASVVARESRIVDEKLHHVQRFACTELRPLTLRTCPQLVAQRRCRSFSRFAFLCVHLLHRSVRRFIRILRFRNADLAGIIHDAGVVLRDDSSLGQRRAPPLILPTAGNMPNRPAQCPTLAVHPRVRGKHRAWRRKALRFVGSSARPLCQHD